MKVLGLDTATRATAVAIADEGQGGLELTARDDPAPGARPGHTARLLPLAVGLLERAGGGWEGIDRIAVGLGPGTFTGLRIGIATARALAEARSIPLVGISTLHALAWGAKPAAAATGAEWVLAVIDARRGELFAAAWTVGGARRANAAAVLEPAAYQPAALVARIGQEGCKTLAIGDGAVPFRELLERAGAAIPADDSSLHKVSAIGHCRLAAAITPGPTADIRPAYLRLPDAELSRRAAQR